jgi:hypothetical protein
MPKLYFLARYINKNVGGGLLRLKQVELLRQAGVETILILPNYQSDEMIVEDDCIQIPFKGTQKIELLKQHLGIVDDYLHSWEADAFKYLSGRISSGDIVFASASGELSCLKLASRLKETCRSRYVANLHDPLDYSKVNGQRFGDRLHVSRERSERKYLSNADLIITSSQTYRKVLGAKYPKIASRIINNYFGYPEKIELRARKPGGKLRIVYGGSFQSTQGPEILAKASLDLDGVEIYFIGNHKNYQPIQAYRGKFTLIDSMPHQDYLDFITENVDVGFVSLARDYLGVCVPSKIFEYLNLGLPMIGALPEGDAKDLINEREYGLAAHFKDIKRVREHIVTLCDPANRRRFGDNVLRQRDTWEMKNQFAEILDVLREMS